MGNGIKAILMDMDGTILDSETPALSVVSEVLSGHMGRPLKDAELLKFMDTDWYQALSDLSPGDEQSLYDMITEKLNERLKPVAYRGIKEALERALDSGTVLGVVSTMGHRAIENTLEALAFNGLFTVVVGGDDTAARKPHPDPLLMAAKYLKIGASSCVYVGDQPGDINAARAAGMKSAAALWGKGERSLELLDPDFILEKPEEIKRLC